VFNPSLAMDDLLPQLGVALLLIVLGFPLLVWFALRFPSTTGALGLVTVVLELLRILGTPAETVSPSSGTPTPPSHAAPSGDSSQGGGTGLIGPEVHL
jgi:hypothetical protein